MPNVLLAYLVCAIIWGTTWFGIRVCIGVGGFPVYSSAAIRFSVSMIILALVWLVRKRVIKPPTREETGWILAAGALAGIDYGLIYASEVSLSGGITAVLLATSPLLTALFGAVSKTEKMSLTASLGSVIAVVGVALVFHDRLQVSAAQATAVGMLCVVCVLGAIANVIMKKYANGVGAVPSNTLYFLSASLCLWAVSIFNGEILPVHWNLGPSVALFYLTIFGTLIAFASFFYLLKHVRLSTATTLSLVTPVIALVVDSFVEKAVAMNAETYFGVTVVLVGVAISVLLREKMSAIVSET